MSTNNNVLAVGQLETT